MNPSAASAVCSTKHLGILIGLCPLLLVPCRVDPLESGFATPPVEARLHAYWWWLNGNVTKEAITRDLAAMREKGFGGALIMDAGGAEHDGKLPASTVACKVTVSSAHKDFPASNLCDGNPATFWVSDGVQPGKDALYLDGRVEKAKIAIPSP